MKPNSFNRRSVLARLAVALSAVPALLVAKKHTTPSPSGPDVATPAQALGSMPSPPVYAEFHYDNKGRLVTMVTRYEGG
jgi:hypothetical protein